MARDQSRLRGDDAGVGPDPGAAGELHRMSESKHYRIASGEADIRGWEVRTVSGTHLGEVEDLLIDPTRGEVIMLDVDLNDSRDHINLPIRAVQIDRERNYVIVDSGEITNARNAVTHKNLHTDVRPHETEDARVQDIRYGQSVRTSDTTEETVIERRPIVEEVVIRRTTVEDTE